MYVRTREIGITCNWHVMEFNYGNILTWYINYDIYTFSRNIYKVNSFLYEDRKRRKCITKWFVFLFCQSNFFQFQVTSRFTLQLIHIHTFTVTSTKCNANAMFSVNAVSRWIWLKGHYSLNVAKKVHRTYIQVIIIIILIPSIGAFHCG